MDDERGTTRGLDAEGFRAAQRLANIVLNVDDPNLYDKLGAADNETAAALLGLSTDELERLVVPAMKLSAALAASPGARRSTRVPASRKPRRARRASRTTLPQTQDHVSAALTKTTTYDATSDEQGRAER